MKIKQNTYKIDKLLLIALLCFFNCVSNASATYTINPKAKNVSVTINTNISYTVLTNATYINGTLDSVYINNNQYCYTTIDNITPICTPIDTTKLPLVIRDGEGNQYVVNAGSPPTVTGPTSYLNLSNDNLAATNTLMVQFAKAPNQNFGFDSKEYPAFTEEYECIKFNNGKNYFVANKSIGNGINQNDRVIATYTINNFNAAQLSFKTKGGATLTKTNPSNNSYEVTNIPPNTDCIYAWYNNQKIGKLNIISLNKISKKVILVPVNGASTMGITQQDLNDIYKQANASFTVSTAPNFTFNLGNDGLEEADAKLMSKYSAEMRALRDAYKKKDSLYDKNAYYIFVVSNFSNPLLQGYMVRGRAVGFVTSVATVTDIAHELGHGAFKLEHTFPAIAKSTSDNLMDYANQTHLAKSQWEQIQKPSNTLTWWDSEEDGSAVFTCSKTVCSECPTDWNDLILFDPMKNTTVSENVKNRAKTQSPLTLFNWHILKICAASGNKVNLDYYSVKIKKLPKFNNVVCSSEFLFEFVRKHLNTFLDNNTASFTNYSSNDGTTWESTNPLTSVMTFHIPIKGPIFDDASVICTSYSVNQPTGSQWIFSPIQTPNDNQHPVSGNRQFGLRQIGDEYEFYIRGADRLTGTMDQLLGSTSAFEGADNLWRSFQSKLVDFINRNSGEAEIDNTKYHWARYTW